MPSKKRLFGDMGENLSCKYLKNAGYSILARNYQVKFGEIDIIAKKDDILVFIEVKSSNHTSNITPEENFTKNKLAKLLKTIEIYMISNKIPLNATHRIDLIAVILNKSTYKASLKHFKNIIS